VGVVASTLAWVSVVAGLGVSAAGADTVKLLPVNSPDEVMAQPNVSGLSAVARGGSGFALLTLGGQAVKWGGAIGSGATVRYAFVTAETARPGAVNCRTLIPISDRLARSNLRRSHFEGEVRRAMDDWSAVANIEFVRVDDSTVADLLIGGEKDPRGIAYADVQRGSGTARGVAPIAAAAMCFNLDLAWEDRFDGDPATPNARYVAAHELGHAVGLDHAWGADKLMRFQYEERFYVPQKADIAGAAFLYGLRSAAQAPIRNASVPR
jgi:hypothetical protein